MSLISSRIPEHPYVPSSVRYATRSEKSEFGLIRFLKRCFLIGMIAVVILNLGQYAHSQRYAWFPKRWGTVIPEKVFRSGQLSESIVEEMLAINQIEVILDLNGKDIYDPEQCEELVAAEKLDIEVHRFQLCGDGTGDLDRYANAVALVDQIVKEDKRLLVHCSAGTKRTGGVIAFYRLLVLEQDPEFVLDELTRYGMKKDPSRPLYVYLENNMQKMAQKLVEKGVLNKMPESLPKLPL